MSANARTRWAPVARGGFAALAVACAALPCDAATAGPLCSVHASLEPADARVGEQVIHRVWIERADEVQRIEWLRAPSFPGARSERLPGQVERRIEPMGTRVRWERVETSALFPAHAGDLVVGEGAIRCTSGVGDDRALRQDVALPALRLRVTEPPRTNRPKDYTGLVGPVQLTLKPERSALRVGESVGLRLGLRGEANLWAAPSPFSGLSLPRGAELFVEAPSIALEPGSRLYLRRRDRALVVPRQPGPLEIPALRVSFYDPATGTYGYVQSAALILDVQPRATAVDAAVTSAGALDTAQRITEQSFFGPARRGLQWIAPSVGVALLALAALGWPIYEARRRRWRAAESALARARRALDAGDGAAADAALERAIRAILAVVAAHLASLPADEIACADGDDALLSRLARTLSRLEESRYGESSRTVEFEAVAELLAAARVR